MATANPTPEVTPSPSASLLVFIAPMEPARIEGVLANLSALFSPEEVVVATAEAVSPEAYGALRILPIQASNTSWALAATDFVNVFQLAQQQSAQAILMLGPGSESLPPAGLHALAEAVLAGTADLAVPCYDLQPLAGLVNAAILYPLSRALFASRVRFPLAIDLGLTMRMAERLALAGMRFTSLNQPNALIWPVNEAAAAGFGVHEITVGPRLLPQPAEADLNSLLALVAGSLFADIDAKASFWQRARALPVGRCPVSPSHMGDPVDTAPMLDAFRLAYVNLREIWSLVLTPNSLLGLKRLYTSDPAAFHMPDVLWVRIVYDFLLAYRMRTINRGHLLGALTPLYLAWAASHIRALAAGVDPERSIEALAGVFEAEKPYLVSRWRWPDRFNP